jgi:hypothetical protein
MAVVCEACETRENIVLLNIPEGPWMLCASCTRLVHAHASIAEATAKASVANRVFSDSSNHNNASAVYEARRALSAAFGARIADIRLSLDTAHEPE